jgi:hypothetical protein
MVFENLEEAQASTDPGKLYRALHACSAEAHRDVSLGRERGAYLGSMCSAHYANRFLTTLDDLPPMTRLGRSDMKIANTILSQLGGQRFLVMTGAKFLLAHESALSFHLPSNFATNGINRVRIDLTPTDLYDMTFMRARGLKVFYQSTIEGLNYDQLRTVFTEATGLEVSLGSLRAARSRSAL